MKKTTLLFLFVFISAISFSQRTYWLGEFKSGSKIYLALIKNDKNHGLHIRMYNTNNDRAVLIYANKKKNSETYKLQKKYGGWSDKNYLTFSNLLGKDSGYLVMNSKPLSIKKISRNDIPNYIKGSRTEYKRTYVKN
ncbi:hypothetical protein TOREUM_30691 [Tenacibaculum litoreum]|jgi:hypothetical protein|uniref:hypothetical protein n=1 Tax=Tenacibaculum TaxID=104267 RepID=UPI0038945BEC